MYSLQRFINEINLIYSWIYVLDVQALSTEVRQNDESYFYFYLMSHFCPPQE